MSVHIVSPPHECSLCPRLASYREENRKRNPEDHNAPVPGAGPADARVMLLGLAPGRMGANRTGLPFTGDVSGAALGAAMAEAGLDDAFITNALLCAPPGNKPSPAELRTCRPHLEQQIKALPRLRVIVALGEVAHRSAIKACGGKLPKYPFGHGAEHRLHTGWTVIDSYHPSPLNSATGRLAPGMLAAVLRAASARCDDS
jgi:uracil-DNA glycosylase family 4